MTDINPIITKIAKILAKADDQAGTPEGELAAKLAAKMMREHAIEMAQVQEVSLDADPLIEDRIEIGRVTWRAQLGWVLAEHCSCKALRQSLHTNAEWDPYAYDKKTKKYGKFIKKGSQTARMLIYGHKTDVQVCQYLFVICERQIEDAARVWKKKRSTELQEAANMVASLRGVEAPRVRVPYSEGQAFRESMILGLSSRLREIRNAGKGEDPTGTALVLRRAEKANEFMLSKNDNISKTAYKKSTKGEFNRDAFEKGKKMRLHEGVEAKQAKATITDETKLLA